MTFRFKKLELWKEKGKKKLFKRRNKKNLQNYGKQVI